MFADVSFPISSYQTFSYKVPKVLKEQVAIGVRVKVPFGNRKAQGIVVGIQKTTEFKGKISEIESLIDNQPVLNENLWSLIKWLSEYYYTPLGIAAKVVLPANLSTKYKPKNQLFVKAISKENPLFKRAKAQKAVYDYLVSVNELVSVQSLNVLSSNSTSICKKLATKGLVYLEEKPIIPDLTRLAFNPINKKIRLTRHQNKALEKMTNAMDNNSFKPFLLHGVTGSGKTEIYVKLAQEAISIGKNVMVLIPEIILTTQMKKRFIKYFGENIAMWHSKMTNKEKKLTIKNILLGEHKIIIGARSSIFAPLPNIGLIVVDEEQDSSYKQESPKPYYNARDIALIRAKYAQCPTVLTSATPSIETYYNTIIGKSKYIELNERYYRSKDPVVEIIDMIKFLDNDDNKIISPNLEKNIAETLENKKQVILLNNRRGYASAVFNKDQQGPMLCQRCNVPMSLHKSFELLLCHHCDYNEKFDDSSQESDNIILNGYGTEKIYEILKIKFPSASISRVDSDSLKSRNNLSSILKNFSSGKIDILIGTQMISKGLDFNDVQLVGVVNADYGMFIPDFRSGEKTFQIISQVIGRSGRRDEQGKAIIQTYNPEDSNLLHAIQSNFKTFYSSNLAERNELKYPPFYRLCRLIFSGEDIEKVNNIALKITKIFSNNSAFKVLGPSEAPISKIKNKWRVNSLIAASKENPLAIQNFFKEKIGTDALEKKYKNVNIKFDIDPLNML